MRLTQMESKTYPHIQNSSSFINNPNQIYSDNNNRSNIVITQPTINKLLSETIKEEEFENNSTLDNYSSINRSTTNITQLPPPTVINTVHLNPRDTINGLSAITMTNAGGHLMSTLNPAHLTESAGTYFVSGLTDLASNYKLPTSSNSDLPSPSSSSNSSNPPSSSHHHHQNQHNQTRRPGEGGDPTRKRAMRLQKNREAARECRRKKKEYIKCLEERVAGLENQNKALIEELRHLKELYCQREDTNNKSNNNKTTTTTTGTR